MIILDQSEPWVCKTIAKILKVIIEVSFFEEQIDLIAS
jgi:hypothetical protein